MDWPQPNERLFVSGADWEHNACVVSYSESLSTYAWYYKEGADELIRSAVEDRSILDGVIRPIVYLYRQHVELTLKEIIYLSRSLQNETSDFPHHHNLVSLWDEAKRRLIEEYGSSTPTELNNLDTIVTEFSHHDPQSFAFRYPWDKKGQRTLPNIRHINVRNLRETMDRVSSFLSCICGDLSARVQCRCDAEREAC